MRLVPPYDRHISWLHRVVKNSHVFEDYGIELKQHLGCGVFGCAFRVNHNRVLKITTSRYEAGTWDIIFEEQRRNALAMRGIATVFMRPFGIDTPVHDEMLYGILREGLTNVRDTKRLYDGILPIDGPSFPRDPTPLIGLDKMVMAVPETALMAAAIRHLYLVTGGIYFLSDLHTENVGRRQGESWLILRDPGEAWTPTAGMEFDYWEPVYVVAA
jgi:hypothetical protein